MSRSTSLRLNLRPSRLLAALIVAAHGAAAICTALVLPGLAGSLLAAALLFLGLVVAWDRALLRAQGSVRAIEIVPSGVIVELAGGGRFPALVDPRRFVSRLMVTLAVRRPSRRTLLVTSDMLDRELFRRLRVWAIWGKLPPVARKQLPA